MAALGGLPPNVVDSTAWLAYFADEPSADLFAPLIEDLARLVVPSVVLAEVFRVVTREHGEGEALRAAAVMRQGRVVDLDATLAQTAGRIAADHRIPLAAAIVHATARAVGGIVWTHDDDLRPLPGVEYVARRKKG
ncbi:MAG: type II toxin-antitoxin system VapC family toxin [Gemmatimonadaceae bacterium]|jgi:predicted nucleic acid-binding protein|nr:type II toxin-antitoxin system VapC family toxin [Gemmatimonadaceae bacterium]